MFDLAKSLSVEEDEEFRFTGNDTLYRVHNNLLEYYWGDDWLKSSLTVNEILRHKIKWLPKVGEYYYTVDFSAYRKNVTDFKFEDDVIDNRLLQAGLIFKTEEEAKDMADYLLKKIKEYRKID